MRQIPLRRTLPFLILPVFLLLSSVLFVRRNHPATPEASTQNTLPPRDYHVTPVDYRYLVQESEGELVIYAVADQVPQRIAGYPMQIETLPGSDQQDLRRGIALLDTAQLQRVLEDYLEG
jgi:hypothetical protein